MRIAPAPVMSQARCGVHHELLEPPGTLDLAPQCERSLELDSDLRPRLGAPVRMEHHAQDAIDAEPGMPEAGVGVALFVYFVSGPRGSTVSGQHSISVTFPRCSSIRPLRGAPAEHRDPELHERQPHEATPMPHE